MKNRIFNTDESWAPFIMRIILGVVIFAHGAQKLFGWFNGYGFQGTMDYFVQTVGLPWIIGFSIIVLESLGAIGLILGFATRLLALSYTLLAAGIILTVHLQNGFFMNWGGNQPGEGFEFFLLWIGLSLALVLAGGGKFSLDKAWIK
ncbi:MAG: DoxX family protein [Saprospiraceae bacterium]|nr:DoxX family protein [Saprospiraceae bacterium]